MLFLPVKIGINSEWNHDSSLESIPKMLESPKPNAYLMALSTLYPSQTIYSGYLFPLCPLQVDYETKETPAFKWGKWADSFWRGKVIL